ncbi:MAG: hypothetical protein ABSG98_10700 [Anaerolineales bacterium]|jgi:hypothetical protein
MKVFDLCLAWNWEYDADFVGWLGKACGSRGLLLLQVTPDNLPDMSRALDAQETSFRAFLDRASEGDERFVPVARWAAEHDVYRINPSEVSSRCSDKAAMHSLLIQAGLETPRTILLPSYQERPVLPAIDLNWVGERFIIKPAHGGGGEGVVTDASSLDQVLEARRSWPQDRYLLQARVVPRELGVRPAWFRVLYCAGCVYPCWWNPRDHIYAPLSPEEESLHGLGVLRETVTAVARLCKLDLFSTEIALTEQDRLVVVDYVNDQIDLRQQSKAADGVPDRIVEDIAKRLTELVITHIQPGRSHERYTGP